MRISHFYMKILLVWNLELYSRVWLEITLNCMVVELLTIEVKKHIMEVNLLFKQKSALNCFHLHIQIYVQESQLSVC